MFGNLLKRLRKPERVAKSSLESQRDSFLREIGERDLLVIVAVQSSGIELEGLTQESLLAEIERAAKDLSERQEFQPFMYERDGRSCLPFFTTTGHAEAFVGECCRAQNRLIPMPMISIRASMLVTLLPACDLLVMNDASDDEIVFSDEDLDVARGIWK